MNKVIHRDVPVLLRGETLNVRTALRFGGGPTLLYLHGLGSTSDDLLIGERAGLLGGLDLVAPDFPGHGGSDYPRTEGVTIDDLVTIVRQLSETLVLGRVHLMGHSMGGLTGLMFAASHPEMVTSFINLEGNLAPEDCGVYSRATLDGAFLGAEEAFFSRLAADMARSGKPGFGEMSSRLRGNVNTPRAWYHYCASIVDCSDNLPLLEIFRKLPVPRVFIHGDGNADLSYLPALARARIPVKAIADSDHFPAYSNPTELYAFVEDYVASPL